MMVCGFANRFSCVLMCWGVGAGIWCWVFFLVRLVVVL